MRARVQYTEHIPNATLLPLDYLCFYYSSSNYYDIIVVIANSYYGSGLLPYIRILEGKSRQAIEEMRNNWICSSQRLYVHPAISTMTFKE